MRYPHGKELSKELIDYVVNHVDKRPRDVSSDTTYNY